MTKCRNKFCDRCLQVFTIDKAITDLAKVTKVLSIDNGLLAEERF